MYQDERDRRIEFVDQQTRELAFAQDSDHYADEVGNQKQPGRVKPKGRQTFGVIRHKSGQFARSELHLQVIAAQYGANAKLAAAAKAAIVNRMTNPEVRFKQIREACAIGALSARQWAYKWEYDPLCKKVLASLVDGRTIGWSAGYQSPHDPRCPMFFEAFRMATSEARNKKNWKNNKDLNGDAGESTISHSNLPAGDVDLQPAAVPALRPSTIDTYTTVVYIWERGYKSQSRNYKPGTLNELPDAEKYLACMHPDGTGCGYVSQKAGDLVDEGELEKPTDLVDMTTGPDGEDQPIAGGCPDCGGDLHLVSHTEQEYVSNSDNTLTIFAPYEGPDGEILWSGPWPHNTTTIPYVIYTCYLHPGKSMGQSETSLNWTPQLAHNLVMRLGLEHMLLAKPYMSVPRSAVDYQGRRWEFGEDQGLGIYHDPMSPPGQVAAVQALGLPPAWSTLEGRLDAVLMRDLGSSDFALSPDQTRDIPVGTMQIQQQEGEVPVLAQTARWQFEDGVGLGTCFEIMQATMTDEELLQVQGDDGQVTPSMIRVSSLPKMNVVVTTDPNTLAIRTQDLDALMKLGQMPRPLRRFAARRLNIPYEQVLQLEKDEDAEMQRQGGPAGPGGPPLPPALAARAGMPGPMPGGPAPPMNGAPIGAAA